MGLEQVLSKIYIFPFNFIQSLLFLHRKVKVRFLTSFLFASFLFLIPPCILVSPSSTWRIRSEASQELRGQLLDPIMLMTTTWCSNLVPDHGLNLSFSQVPVFKTESSTRILKIVPV